MDKAWDKPEDMISGHTSFTDLEPFDTKIP